MTALSRTLALSLLALTLGSAAQAACFADYKAKRTNPLKLHYGVIELSDAECEAPAAAVAARIAAEGWELLTVMDVFDKADAEKRKSDAGTYYLRY
ncbi:hypothetical protein ILP92_01335 [Maribius pontilimi]|uniref:DUF4177 domain-containing protein n=1 Tax=Palleronia pontilimi TaxID=1964209 RepID=A0A934I6K5_9RHOB|nr:hypothetical protein [Palleronia pontilimi]